MSKTEFVIEPGRQDIVMTREFDAARDLVFRACTEPELFRRWIGSKGRPTEVDIWEPHHGGRYRWHLTDDEGREFAFRGVFHEVSPERIVQTFEWEGMIGHICLTTITLEELPGGRTRYVGLDVFQTVEDRDGMVSNGMQGGAEEGMDQLADVLASL
ncbi:SRPBCC family protein [Actinocorallia longicatena]|uniref:SRPBCC family protein n=1 Tax=Actinocorallia longicatena TaxID=111803 RepID=A0ABP6Q5U5_9ACTN